VDETEYLNATLNRTHSGARLPDLAAALVTDEISQEAAEAYVQELAESQILVPEIALPVTGPEPIHPLIEHLGKHAEGTPVADALDWARAALAAIDADGLGVEPERYRAIARDLEALPAKVELPRLFQVDMVKPAPGATLGTDVVAEIQRGVEILHRLAGSHSQENLK